MSATQAASTARRKLTSDAESAELIYHYTKFETGVSILHGREIWLNSYVKTGDPREVRGWVYMGIDGLKAAHPKAKEIFERILLRSVRLACFTVDRELAPEAVAGSQFHHGWASASMWDRYGDKHTGMCLALDRGKISQALSDVAIEDTTAANEAGLRRDPVDSWMYAVGPVKYLDQQAVVELPGDTDPEAVLASGAFRHVTDELYMIKNRDWAGEREYRLIASCPDLAEDQVLELPIGAEALVAVVVGQDYSGSRPLVPKGVSVFRCTWSGGSPELDDFGEASPQRGCIAGALRLWRQ